MTVLFNPKSRPALKTKHSFLSVAPDITQIGDKDDEMYRERIFSRNHAFRFYLEKEYMRGYSEQSKLNSGIKSSRAVAAANTKLRERDRQLSYVPRLAYCADEDEINDEARAKAQRCPQALAYKTGYLEVEKMLALYGISKPDSKSFRAKVTCPDWWARHIRKKCYRKTEDVCRDMGLVQVKAAPYISDFQLERYLRRQEQSRKILSRMEVENDLGEVFPLEDLIEKSQSNPKLRRNELMAQLRGCEEWADSNLDSSYRPVFYTITCPSRFHAFKKTGVRNPKFDGQTVLQGHQHLNLIWQRARAAFRAAGIPFYGVRVAEPHHDGTPHWLAVFWTPKSKRKAFGMILRKYAFSVDGRERGARQHRFQSLPIDPRRGSAAGYVAKYISKNIDGFQVQIDEEAEDYSAITAIRAKAWASTHGIHQFQLIGLPSVTVYREARRIANIPEEEKAIAPEDIEKIVGAADSGEWRAYIESMGGVAKPLKCRPARAMHVLRSSLGRYGNPVKAIRGVYSQATGEIVISRLRQYVIRVQDYLASELDFAVPVLRAPPEPDPLDLCQ